MTAAGINADGSIDSLRLAAVRAGSAEGRLESEFQVLTTRGVSFRYVAQDAFALAFWALSAILILVAAFSNYREDPGAPLYALVYMILAAGGLVWLWFD